MKTRFIYAVLLSASTLLPAESIAQSPDVGITAAGLVSIQPTDGTYRGPYLSQGLGGTGPGWGIGVSAIAPGGFVGAGEFTTARFELMQAGRLVSGSGADQGTARTSRLHDSMLSGLVGYAESAGRARALWLGGMSMVLGSPTVDGVARGSGSTFAFTGGLDIHLMLGGRAALIIGGRYSRVQGRPQRSLGIGPHVMRIGMGIRVRTN